MQFGERRDRPLTWVLWRFLRKARFFWPSTRFDTISMIDELARSAAALASKGIGALIAVERRDPLTDYVNTGVIVDALLSRKLLEAIFSPASPIKGGGVIISRGRIAAADCLLPRSMADCGWQNGDVEMKQSAIANPKSEIEKERKKAALGLTEETDAFAIVVSEDGSIALTMGRKLESNLDPLELRRQLLVAFSATKAFSHQRSAISR
ncbi:MAG: diadenylate cyclase [Candidatus Methylomirabilales bacterium]